jgi:L-alanine-DL-glutamate epimerase-like enolase superfamily enzyme
MRIADARIHLLRVPYLEQPAFQLGYDRDRDILLLELETDTGLVGLGYQLYLAPGFETARTCLREMMLPRIMGRDPTEVEAIWRELFMANYADGRMGITMLAQSIIDVALWDIVGQAAGMPLHRLWGHYRKQLPVYGSGCWRGLGGDGMVAKAIRFAEQGYGAIKMQVGHSWDPDTDVDNVRRVREAVGAGIDIMVDVNMAWSVDDALAIGRRICEYDLYWLEEPVRADDYAAYRRLAQELPTRIVGGENHFTRFDMRAFFGEPLVPILQPDVMRGGLTELRKIAAVADTWGIRIAPHLYPELMVQLLASIPNGLILEDMGLMDDIWIDPIVVSNGMVTAPESPGHGLRVRSELLVDCSI